MHGYFITGTDTGVGKTEVAASLIEMFSKKGFRVGVMKPVATGVKKVSKDAVILKKRSFLKDSIRYINPLPLKLPLAPLVAANIEKKRIDMKVVWERFKKLSSKNDIMIVEGIGGVMVPICRIGKKIFYVSDMISKMKLPVIIVSRPNLGTINHTLMTVKILRSRNIKIAGIIFNYSRQIKRDLSLKTNPKTIERLSGVRVLGIMRYRKDRNKRRVKWLKKI